MESIRLSTFEDTELVCATAHRTYRVAHAVSPIRISNPDLASAFRENPASRVPRDLSRGPIRVSSGQRAREIREIVRVGACGDGRGCVAGQA